MKSNSPTFILIALCALSLRTQAEGTNEPTLPASLDLTTACALALEHNPSIRSAREVIRMQDGTVMSQRAAGLPTLEAVGNYMATDKNRIESFGGESSFNDQTWSADLQVRQSLFSGGRLHYTLEAQKHMSAALDLSLEDVTQAVVRDTTEYFHAALLAKERIAVHEEAVTLLASELALSSNRFNSGVGQKFDILRAEVALRNEQPLLLRARNDFTSSIDALIQIIGIRSPGGNASVTLVDSPDVESSLTLSDLPQFTQQALDNRPSLLLTEKEVLAGLSNLEVAERGHMPSLSLTAAYGVQNLQFSEDVTEVLDGWKLGVQFDWPIFDSQLTKGDILHARAQLTQKEIQQEATLLAVENQVRRELSACQTAKEILLAAEGVIEQATEALRLAQNRLETGIGTQLDVLDAQVGLSRARLQKATARYDYHVAAARLKYAVGQSEQP